MVSYYFSSLEIIILSPNPPPPPSFSDHIHQDHPLWQSKKSAQWWGLKRSHSETGRGFFQIKSGCSDVIKTRRQRRRHNLLGTCFSCLDIIKNEEEQIFRLKDWKNGIIINRGKLGQSWIKPSDTDERQIFTMVCVCLCVCDRESAGACDIFAQLLMKYSNLLKSLTWASSHSLPLCKTSSHRNWVLSHNQSVVTSQLY